MSGKDRKEAKNNGKEREEAERNVKERKGTESNGKERRGAKRSGFQYVHKCVRIIEYSVVFLYYQYVKFRIPYVWKIMIVVYADYNVNILYLANI